MSRLVPDRHDIARMHERIRTIEMLDEAEFLLLEYGLVSHYRRHARDQERIAVELTRKNMSSATAVGRSRTDEILAMLAHVHDPMIAASI